MAAEVIVKPMHPGDWDAVAVIYRDGIETGDATFENEVPGFEEWDRTHHLQELRFVALDLEGTVVGFISAAPISPRPAYRGVIEHSLYVALSHHGRGIGRRLLEHFIEESEEAGYWTIQTGIFPENEVSLALHRSCGFRDLGIRRHVGHHRGRWRDVALLERRSRVVGVPPS